MPRREERRGFLFNKMKKRRIIPFRDIKMLQNDSDINLYMASEEAELVMTAVLLLAEQTGNAEHARILRRAGMQIDEQLPK